MEHMQVSRGFSYVPCSLNILSIDFSMERNMENTWNIYQKSVAKRLGRPPQGISRSEKVHHSTCLMYCIRAFIYNVHIYILYIYYTYVYIYIYEYMYVFKYIYI